MLLSCLRSFIVERNTSVTPRITDTIEYIIIEPVSLNIWSSYHFAEKSTTTIPATLPFESNTGVYEL